MATYRPRVDDQFCDAVLKTTDGGVFKIHRVILAATSPYFRDLLAPRRVDSCEFVIQDISATMMGLLVNHAYSGLTEVTEENVRELMAAAVQFQVDGVVKDCTAFLAEKKANKLANFLQVSQSEEFLKLSPEDLVALLTDDRLNVRTEKQVWEAGLRWIEHEPDNRMVYVPEVLRSVRLGLLEISYFYERVKNHHYVSSNNDCMPIVKETLSLLRDLEGISSRTEPVQSPLLATPRIPHHVLFVIGGNPGEFPYTDRIETYDTKADRWIQINEVLPAGPRAYHKLGVIGHNIYVIGGRNENNRLPHEYFSSCHCFNAVSKQWRELAPMHCKRGYLSVVTLDDHIYAMGGAEQEPELIWRKLRPSDCLNSVERYDPPRNQWTLVAPMRVQRSDAGATTQDGYIYVVGGYDGADYLRTAERYDPATDTWTDIAPMQHRRAGVSVISYHGNIYALGGNDDIQSLASGERYDPATDQWSSIPDMTLPRNNFDAVVMEDKIFVMGGYKRSGWMVLSDVEYLDDRKNEWIRATHMHTPLNGFSACVLSGLPNIYDYVHQNRQGLFENKRQTTSKKRLRAKLMEMYENPPPLCSVGLKIDNLYEWTATIEGPPESVYEGGNFVLDLKFDRESYPFKPPKVKFVTKIYHCNIDQNGNICADVFDMWTPVTTISSLLVSICSLLTDPNPSYSLSVDIGALYLTNRTLHDENARKYTEKYAM